MIVNLKDAIKEAEEKGIKEPVIYVFSRLRFRPLACILNLFGKPLIEYQWLGYLEDDIFVSQGQTWTINEETITRIEKVK